MNSVPPVVLTIAGFDPSSGAGVTADIKTIAAQGCYGIAAITALTVQSTQGVQEVNPIDADILERTLENLALDFQIAAVHIGMVANSRIIDAVARFLADGRFSNVVLDPILISTSGAKLLDDNGLRGLSERLIPLATVITPNADEAAKLTGLEVKDPVQMREVATQLHAMGAKAVVITGGHLEEAEDILGLRGAGGPELFSLKSKRIPSNSTHGTGCAFSTSIACQLALGKDVKEAVWIAKRYVTEGIDSAYQIGRGIGPINHFHGVQLR